MPFIGISRIPRILRGVVNGYLKRSGVAISPHLEIDNYAMAISLVTAERGVALLPPLDRGLSAALGRQPALERRATDRRSDDRLSQGEHVPDPENVPLADRRAEPPGVAPSGST
ncbi:MAG: hypothetical protein WDO24_13025 [Pseudomonadota bacterium]